MPVALAALLLAAFALALAASRRVPALRPLAALLLAGLALDVIGAVAALAYVGHRAPGEHYAGTARAAFHLAQVAWLTWPALATGHVARELAHAPRWAAVGPWAGLCAAAVLTYPLASPDAPAPALWLGQAMAGATCAASVAAWARAARWPSPATLAALAIAGGEVALALAWALPVALGAPPPWLAVAPWSRAATWAALCVVGWRTWSRARTSRSS